MEVKERERRYTCTIFIINEMTQFHLRPSLWHKCLLKWPDIRKAWLINNFTEMCTKLSMAKATFETTWLHVTLPRIRKTSRPFLGHLVYQAILFELSICIGANLVVARIFDLWDNILTRARFPTMTPKFGKNLTYLSKRAVYWQRMRLKKGGSFCFCLFFPYFLSLFCLRRTNLFTVK